MGLATRLLLASAALAVAVAAVLLVVVRGTVELRDATDKRAQSRLALDAAARVEKDVLDLETGVRGFVITRRERFLEPWRTARSRLPRDLASLRRRLRDEPDGRRLAGGLATAARGYLGDYTEPLIAAVRARRRGTASAATTTAGKRRVDGIRRLLERLGARERAETARLSADADAKARSAVLLGTGSIVGSIALIVLFGAYLARGVVGPIRRVGSAADRLAGGEAGTRAPDGGAPELAQLGRSFNRMAAAIGENRARLESGNIELAAATRDAERANQEKSQFISRMSHELRTPLNAILGFGQLLQLDELDEGQRESVDHILRGGRHLLELIDEVLDIARVEAGELRVSPEPVEVRGLVEETIALVGPLADQRSIALETEFGELGEANVMADRQRLKQVLLNLLSNAIKYNRHAGSVRITVEPRSAGRLAMLVTDTGPGIPREQLSKLFEPFERLGAERADIAGTGLGLALSRRLTEAMDGTLEAESEPGRGSTLCVELAVAAALEPAAAAPPADVDASLGSRTILYIEDNLSNLRLIERVLARHSEVTLLPAMQAELGLELAREHRPDVVLLDLHLPDLGGYEVLRRLQAEPATRATPVVILSADATPGQVRRLQEAGAHAYLTKPIDVRELLEVVGAT